MEWSTSHLINKGFMASLKSGEQICYAFARIDVPYISGMIVSALDYQFRPILI